MRLLVVEDDRDINRQVVNALEEAGYVADKAFDGEEGGYLGENEPYDAIISLGAMEHFARPEVTTEEKIESYRAFFTRCHEWLRPGGRLSIQAIAYGNLKREDFAGSFIARDIFPESEFVRLAEIAEASERRFEILRVRNDRRDYERTCAVWLEKLRANRDRAVEAAGEDLTARYERYLDLCVRGWQLGASP